MFFLIYSFFQELHCSHKSIELDGYAGWMMAKPKAKKQCEDDIEKKFANIVQQGLSSTLQALKSQLNNKPMPGNRFCWREGIHLQFCQLDIASP